MMKNRLLILLLSAMMICPLPAAAEEETKELTAPASLDERISEIVSYYGLSEGTLSVAYYNTVTSETYEYCEDIYMFAASTYKLPLNMYYYMKENSGEISSDAVVGGYTLSNAHYLSIVNSDNAASEAMMNALGSYSEYKNLMLTTFGDSYYGDLDNVNPIIYTDNDYPAGFLMNVLQYLWQNQDQFQELLSYMSSPDQINAVDNTLKNYVTVYQKQGWYNEVNTLTEIVMTEQPYLAVIMVDDPSYQSPSILSDINTAVYEYHSEYMEYSRQVESYVNENYMKTNSDNAEKSEKNIIDPAVVESSPLSRVILTLSGILVLLLISSLVLRIRPSHNKKRHRR